MISADILETLSKGQQVECVISEDDLTISWVTILRIFPSRVTGIKIGQSIKPNAQYVIKWIEMSKQLYNAYLNGNDVTANDGEIVEREFADDEHELASILSRRLSDLHHLVPRRKNQVRLP